MTVPGFADALRSVLAEALGDHDVAVADLHRLSGGASRETWSLIAVGSDGSRRPLILQRDEASSVRTTGGMGLESEAIRAATAGGVPVPALLASSADDEPLGAPFLLSEHVAGETIARKIQRDEPYATARDRFAADAGRALAAVHAIDPAEVPSLERPDQLTRYREILDELGPPHPTFELAFRWLESTRPDARPDRMVHGDFRLGNLIIDTDGLAAVIDWELVHLGDPVEDLAWLCVKAWRFGGRSPVAGLGSYDELLDAYGEASGTEVDRAALRWWEVAGTLKWGIMCIMQANGHLSGLRRSHELAAIGRRVCENELDLLDLMAP
ncbi:MAG: phosphotransferase family protein [Actinomycetota bacterium]